MNESLRNRLYLLALLPFAVVVMVYELIPLLTVLVNGFLDGQGGMTLNNFQEIFTKTIYRSAIGNSIRISFLSALIGIILAFVAANSYDGASPAYQKLFTMILNMTSNFSGIPLAFGFMLLIGNAGFIRMLGEAWSIGWLSDLDLYSSNGLMLVYIYFQVPLATLLLIPAFAGIRKEWKEAAVVLHAMPFDFWTRVGIPFLLPGILGTLSVLFSNALAAYATAYAIFLNNYALLPLQLTKQYKGDVTINRQMGGALSLIMILLMLAATLIDNYIIKKTVKGGGQR